MEAFSCRPLLPCRSSRQKIPHLFRPGLLILVSTLHGTDAVGVATAVKDHVEAVSDEMFLEQKAAKDDASATAQRRLMRSEEKEVSADEVLAFEHHVAGKAAPQQETGSALAWSETATWLRKEGAEVNGLLRGQAILHSNISERSVVSDSPLKTASTLIVVPKRLWIHLDNFPNFRDAVVPSGISSQDSSLLKLAGAMATESKKGNASFFASYLRRLPTLADVRSFHPRLAAPQLMSDFGALPLVRLMRASDKVDSRLQKLFEAWQKTAGHPAALDSLAWDDMKEALFRIRSRRISVGANQSALVPGVDLMNTAIHDKLNTQWGRQGDRFVVTASKPVEAGQEVVIDYCKDCDNHKFLAMWGMYMEGNPVKLDPKNMPDCLATRSGITDEPVVLKEVTEAVLELTSKDLAAKEAGKAVPPRCKPEGLAQLDNQGPLRCSLARLAWEFCSRAWAVDS